MSKERSATGGSGGATGGSRRSRTRENEPRKLTEGQLEAFAKSKTGRHPMVKRLIATMRGLFDRVWELEDARRRAREQFEINARFRQNQVLVVQYHDGYTEVYAKPWIIVHMIQAPDLPDSLEVERQVRSAAPGSVKDLLDGAPKVNGMPNTWTYQERLDRACRVAAILSHIIKFEEEIRAENTDAVRA